VTYKGQVTQGTGGQVPANGGVMEFTDPSVKLTVQAGDYRGLAWAVDKYIYNIFVTTAETDRAQGLCSNGLRRQLRLGSGGVNFPTNPQVTEQQAILACSALTDQSENCVTDVRMADDPVAIALIANNFKEVELTVKTLTPISPGTLHTISTVVASLFVAVLIL